MFGLSVNMLTLVGFLLLVWILGKFAWGPIIDLLDKRREKIRQEYVDAEETRAAADGLKADFEAKLGDIKSIERERVQEALSRFFVAGKPGQVLVVEDDKPTREMLARGDTVGVFYVESPAMRGLLKKLRCDNYLSLVAASVIHFYEATLAAWIGLRKWAGIRQGQVKVWDRDINEN